MTALRLASSTPEPERVLRAALSGRDEALATLARLDRIISDQGRIYMAEKYPNERHFVRPTVEMLKREVGA